MAIGASKNPDYLREQCATERRTVVARARGGWVGIYEAWMDGNEQIRGGWLPTMQPRIVLRDMPAVLAWLDHVHPFTGCDCKA